MLHFPRETIAKVCFLLTWLVVACAQAAEAKWRIELDAPADVRVLLEKHLDIYRYRGRPEVDAELLNRLAVRAAPDARQLLATEGYFAAQIDAQVITGDQSSVVRIHVVPGPVARVKTLDIRVIGAVLDEQAGGGRVAQLKASWRLPVEAPFRQASWGDAKEGLLRALVFDAYPAAHIAASEAQVDPESGGVALSVTVDSGPAFRFGALNVVGLERYPSSIVENLKPFSAGQSYSHDAMLRFQAELQASGYFKNASVTMDFDPAVAGAAPVLVRVLEYPAKKVDLGVGLSTDTGPRAEATFTDNNTMQAGWQGMARFKIDAKQQALDGELALLPEAGGWRNRLGLEAVGSDIENLSVRRLGLTARRSWRTPQEERDLALKFQAEEKTVGTSAADTLNALTLNYSWTLRRVDDLLRPRRGYLLNLQLGGAAEPLLSTRSFTRAYGRGLYILPLGRADRLHLRAEVGAVIAASREGIPSEFLFRAGGDQSVRGYGYQSLGVAQGSAIVGARYLGVATAEYQHDFTAQWGGALFVDAGNASDTLTSFRAVHGVGAGVRWITPAGMINFDIARANETGNLRLHFTLGARF